MNNNPFSPQLHCGVRPDPSQMPDAVHSMPAGMNKPKEGLWTSTYLPDGQYASDWLQWCGVSQSSWSTAPRWLLTVDPSASILQLDNNVDSYATLFGLYGRFEYDVVQDRKVHTLDWTRIASDWDAFHLTREAAHMFREWDTESTVWFRWRFTSVVEVLP